MFFYDCESTSGSIYEDHIIEVGAKVVAAPCSTDISQLGYSSLIHSSRIIVKAVQDKCGIIQVESGWDVAIGCCCMLTSILYRLR